MKGLIWKGFGVGAVVGCALLSVFAIASLGVLTEKSPRPQEPPRPQEKGLPKLKPTYADSVGQILNDHCVTCHRPGDVAPFSLVGYEAAKKQAKMIALSTESRRMPPWKAAEGYGEHLDVNRLQVNEIEALKAWAESGAPRGNKAKEPKPPTFSASGWRLGKPDLTIGPTRPFKLEAEGDDVYRNFVFDPKLDAPKYVTAIDVRPGNTKVVHHVIAFLDDSGRTEQLAKENTDGQEGYLGSGGGIGVIPSGALGGWAPGVAPRHTPKSTGFLLKPGTKIVLQIHYHKSGKPESDQTQVGLYFAKDPVEKPINIHWVANPLFKIPVGAKEHVVRGTYPILSNQTIYSIMPHMHLLGKSMKAWVVEPGGKERPLVLVEDWDFNWQLVYTLKEPLFVKKGSMIRFRAVYDNSESNPYRTEHAVTWGEQTTDEMALLLVTYSEGEPPRLASAR